MALKKQFNFNTAHFKPGFTFIEILISLAIIAIVFIPMMQLFSHALFSTAASQDLITATNLARWDMERIKNLNVTTSQLSEVGNTIYPPLAEEPLLMNRTYWRIKREIFGGVPLQVAVHVFKVEAGIPEEEEEPLPGEPMVSLSTLIADMLLEEVK